MKIVVERNAKIIICFPIPSGLVLNRFAAGPAQQYLKKCGLNLTREQTAGFIKALNQYRRRHPEWVLLEAQCSGGEYVKVKL